MTNNYVSKQAAIDIVVYECGKWTGLAKEISKQLKQLPSADVVPVVRCKDCMFRDEDAFCEGRGFPYQLVPDDGFCDKGKRKE